MPTHPATPHSTVSRRVSAIALVLLAGTCPSAIATDRLHLVDGQFDGRSTSVRSRMAADLLAEITVVTSRIPLAGPAERERVDRELAAIGALDNPTAVNARMQQLQRTPAFQQYRLQTTFGVVKQALECAYGARANARREMSCWAIAAHHLEDRALFEDAIPVLRKAGLLPIDGDMTPAKWNALGQRLALYGRGIQENLVIPYLKNDTPGDSPVMQACRPTTLANYDDGSRRVC
jgi:hypothetical protein